MIQSFQGKLLSSVRASPSPAASEAGECKVCEAATQWSSRSGSVSCACAALDAYDVPERQPVFHVPDDETNLLDDWEFAGDEEKEDVEATLAGANLLQLSVPLPAFSSADESRSRSSVEVRAGNDEHVDAELGESRACDWLEPPLPCGLADATQERGGEGVMLEAFQQFQHNPHIQEMVVALATDARVWRAVLANKKLREYTVGTAEGDVEGRLDSVGLQRRGSSSFVVVWHDSLRELTEGLRGALKERVQVETWHVMVDVMVRVLTMVSAFMLTLTAFLFLLPLQASQGA